MKNYQYIFTHSSGNLTLTHNPLNWAGKNILFARSLVYHSVLTSQIVDIEVPLEGKAYIDTIYETYGIDTDIALTIKYLDKSDFTYSNLYSGIIDLSKRLSARDTTIVKVVNGSVMSKFLARHETKVPVNRVKDLDGNTISVYSYLSNMTVNGVDLIEQIYMDYDSTPLTAPATSVNTIEAVSIEETDWNDGTRRYDNPLATTQDVEYTAEGSIDYEITFPVGGGTATLTNYIVQSGTQFKIAEIVLNQGGPGVQSGTHTDSRSVAYTIPISGYVGVMTLEAVWTVGVTGTAVMLPTSSLQIFVITAGFQDTSVSIPLLHEMGAKLLEIITGVADPLDCDLFGRTDSEPRTYGSDGDFSLSGIASGNLLRQFNMNQRPIVTSFKEFFMSMDALFNLGMWYDGNEFIILDKVDFYRDEKIITLGEVQNLETSVATEHYFNKIKAGYPTVSYEEVNGNQNFNVPYEMSNPGQRIDGTLDIASLYHGDDYGVELARQHSFLNGYSEDSRYDDQTFILWGERSGGNYKTVQGSSFDTVTGVYAPDTRLNLDITAKRNILRHLNQLSIPLFISQEVTSYMTKQFNLIMSTKKGGGDPLIGEVSDLDFADLEEPLYYPEIDNFTAPLTNEHILQLQTDPHGYVEYQNLGVTKAGFILEVSTEPFMRKGNWTLIKRNPNR